MTAGKPIFSCLLAKAPRKGLFAKGKRRKVAAAPAAAASPAKEAAAPAAAASPEKEAERLWKHKQRDEKNTNIKSK